MQTTLSTITKITTSRPAPLLPGYHSLQALSTDDVFPSITQYHRTPEPALRWMKSMAHRNLYDAYILSSLEEARWNVYNRHGKPADKRTTILPQEGLLLETTTPVLVDYDGYVASAKAILGQDITCITWAEHQSHASSVGHSNMVVLARDMITVAADKDMEHIYLVDSVASGCRVEGWFMDASKVSDHFMNEYLDRYQMLSKGWPLCKAHHLHVMSHRIATLRPLQLLETLMSVNESFDLGEDINLVRLRLRQSHPMRLSLFASTMFEGMESGVIIQSPRSLEAIDTDVVKQHAHRIAALYRETFLK